MEVTIRFNEQAKQNRKVFVQNCVFLFKNKLEKAGQDLLYINPQAFELEEGDLHTFSITLTVKDGVLRQA